MTTLEEILELSSSWHKHLCPRQVLGARIGLAGAAALGLAIPRKDKRLLAIVETDGCFTSGVEAATGCSVRHRTLRIEDLGKIAVAFVDVKTETAQQMNENNPHSFLSLRSLHLRGVLMRHLPLFFLVLLVIGLIGCATQPTTAVINLSNLEPLPIDVPTEVVPLRVAVAAVISPKGNVDSYGPLLDYLSGELERPVELVQRRTYAEVNDLIEAGDVDMAFVCTSAYVAGARDFGMELLAAPQVDGETVYYSLLIVPADSPAQNLVDLRGGIFAFTDPMSNTGRNYPTYLVQQLGETPDRFFGRTFYTYSHDDAIRAVANQVADGAAVDSLVYEHVLARNPELGQRTRIVHRSPAFGIPPVVVGPHVRPQLAAQLQSILIHMAEDPDGQAALAAAGFERFVSITDTTYDSVRELEEKVTAAP